MEKANRSIHCNVTSCTHHCHCEDYCSLDSIQVGTHETDPKQDQCTDTFYGKAAFEHGLLQPDDAVHIADAEGLGHHQPLLQANTLVQQEDEQGGSGHKTQSTDLNHENDYCLSEPAPLGISVKQRQAGHTGGRGRRKQRRQKATGYAIAGSCRKG